MDPVTASLIVGGTQVASAVGTNVANALMYKRQRADNRQDATTAYQRSIDMWNMNNAYNDPSAQMERLKQAGLNPNLVYGGGATTTASAPFTSALFSRLAILSVFTLSIAVMAISIYPYAYRDWETDRKSTRLNSSHITRSRMPSSA